jgi:hypothetical protein
MPSKGEVIDAAMAFASPEQSEGRCRRAPLESLERRRLLLAGMQPTTNIEYPRFIWFNSKADVFSTAPD